MNWREWLEPLSYLVTIFGFPFAIAVFYLEQRKERQNEDEELYQRLSDEYADFLKLVLNHADLQLIGHYDPQRVLSEEQTQRNMALFQQAMKVWAPFAAGTMPTIPGIPMPGFPGMPGMTPTKGDGEDEDKDEQLAELRKQMEAMQKQLDAMARAKG